MQRREIAGLGGRLSSSQLKTLLGQDPVHLTTTAYKAMSEKAVELLRDETDFINDLANTRDKTLKRSLWVQQDDAVVPVPRRDSNKGKGWRPIRGHSGGCGGHSAGKNKGNGSWRRNIKK